MCRWCVSVTAAVVVVVVVVVAKMICFDLWEGRKEVCCCELNELEKFELELGPMGKRGAESKYIFFPPLTVQRLGKHNTMLYLIGLGLSDETDITVKGLEIVRRAARVYLEAYTSILLVDKSILVSSLRRPRCLELTLMLSRRHSMGGKSSLQIGTW